MKASWLLILFLSAVTTVPRAAAFDDEELERRFAELQEQLTHRARDLVAEVIERLQTPTRPEPLSRTMSLTFSLEPAQSGDQPLTVTCATPAFHIHAGVERPDRLISITIDGSLRETEGKRMLLSYEVELTVAKPDQKQHIELAAEGSALVALEQPTKLAELGERRLMVTAAPAD